VRSEKSDNILTTVIICAFCKTPKAKTDAKRFADKTICVYFMFWRFTADLKSANYASGQYNFQFLSQGGKK